MTIELTQDLEDDIEYYENYKRQLCQFIIWNCSYNGSLIYHQRVRLNEDELLGMLKEINSMEKLIYELKLIQNPDVSLFNFIYNKHFK
tara:strand:+ start:760 stop:1023 length:264 start_codon:yes stop_codon:yes gene_type:complete